jgi:hypothetical protein
VSLASVLFRTIKLSIPKFLAIFRSFGNVSLNYNIAFMGNSYSFCEISLFGVFTNVYIRKNECCVYEYFVVYFYFSCLMLLYGRYMKSCYRSTHSIVVGTNEAMNKQEIHSLTKVPLPNSSLVMQVLFYGLCV